MRLGWDVYIARGATAPNTWQIRPDNPNNGEPLVRERDAPDNITISIRRAGEAAVLQNLNFQPRGTMGGAPTRISLSHNDSPDRHRACLLIAWSGSVTVASADEINRDCIFP
ncbi:MAG: hypothetical protein FWH15_04505 [Betaproteobacteria bacterium]|nr:hypothetical protein [Betaproteobacteria bacterium]